MIWIQGLSKNRDEKEILHNVNLLIPSGVTVGILGEHGAGKSTLVNLIAGTELPSEGKVYLDGSLLSMKSIDSALVGQMTLYQSLRFLGRLYTRDDRMMDEMIEEILALSGLSGKRHLLWSKIPPPDKPILRYAALCVVEADHLLIDAGALAPKKNEAILERMREKIRKTTTLIASSNLKLLKENCDAGIVIHKKGLHYFDAIGEAIKFFESVEKDDSIDS